MLYYEGSAFFEELKGKPSDQQKWQKARLNTYLGSDMHFLRSVIGNRVTEDGYIVMRLIRQPNPKYQHGSFDQYISTLVTKPLMITDYARLTDQAGEYALAFKDHLQVNYRKSITSVITFNGPYIYFDNNGVIINPQDAIMEQAWASSRIAEMLPVDYQPTVK